MNARTRTAIKTCLLVLLGLPTVIYAQTPPTLNALNFVPTSVNTSTGAASVTVNFTAQATGGGVYYFECAFTDPTGVFIQRAHTFINPPQPSVTSSVVVTIRPFSTQGTWNLSEVFIADSNGNTLILDTAGLNAAGISTALQVTSSSDTTPPNIAAFSFSPSSINTTSSPATVNVSFSLTDDLSGANFFQVVFTSPSGRQMTASASFAASTAVTNSATLTFPALSEAGTWTVSSVFISDAAGNTQILNTNELTGKGFPTALTVTSTSDTTPPTLAQFSFSPNSINVSAVPMTVTVNFHVTDDLSGATTLQVAFLSPSGSSTQTASANFPANTSVTGTATVTFPKGSEAGTWLIANVFLSDAAGNTKLLATGDLVTLGFPTQLTVIDSGNVLPPVIVPTVNPAPNFLGWNTTIPVVVSWSVTDPTGIVSSSGCNTVSLGAETSGMTFTCTATNGAGLSSTVSVTVRIDLSPPVVIPMVSPLPNAAGWNNTSVAVSWAVSDPISGINSELTSGCAPATLTAETAGTTLTCMAVNGAGLTQTVSVTVKIDLTPPVTSNTTASPNLLQVGLTTTLTASVADALSGVASAQYNIDGGSFTAMTGTFGGVTANVSATVPAFTTAGIHQLCVRGTDVAGNVGAATCTSLPVFDPNGPFVTAGGNTNSPAGADLANPTGFGPVNFSFNVKYLPHDTVPSGALEYQYAAGNIDFVATGFDYLVATPEPRARVQGTGTINGTTTCKFSLDAWNGSFQPGSVDALGLTIYNCAGGTGNRYNLVTAPIAHGNIQIHK